MSVEVEVVPRSEWRAKPAKDCTPLNHPVGHVIIWPLGLDPLNNRDSGCRVINRLQRKHMEAGHADFKYNFLIGSDRAVYEGRGWHNCSAKDLKYNPLIYGDRLDIAVVGAPDSDIETKYMDTVKIGLLDIGVKNNFIKRFFNLIQLPESEAEFKLIPKEEIKEIDKDGKDKLE